MQRFRYVTLPGLKYVIIVVLLLSFISTFNQFGLIFLMTGGGPGGATKLYSILAYEKAIGSLQYGPGSAIALSVAPLMAILIVAPGAVHAPRRARRGDGPKVDGRRRASGARSAACFSLVLDIIFWPIDMIYRGVDRRRRRRSAAASGSPTSPRSRPRDESGSASCCGCSCSCRS